MRRATLFCAVLALPVSALAVPLEFNHQGRLFDAAGVPLDAPTDLGFRIYDTPSGGTALWTETWSAHPFDDGYFNVRLGSTTPLDSSAFDGATLYLGLTVGAGAELTPRAPLVSVPYAMRAHNADSADALAAGTTVDATELRINGSTVIDSSGMIDAGAVSGASDTLSDLGCTANQIALHNGTQWTCAANEHDADAITSGTLSIDLLPIGTSASHAAAGDHGHTAVDVGALPSGTTAADIGGLASSTTAADLGGVMVGDAVQLGTTSTCGSSAEGTLRWDSGALEVCDGSEWRNVRIAAGIGLSQSNPAPSCGDILSDDAASPDGLYWLDPDGSGGIDAFETWCDMSDGGWALAAAVVSHSPFWTAATYNTGNSARAADLGTANPGQNFVLQLPKWRAMLAREGSSSLFKLTVRRIDNDADVELGRLQGLQMQTDGRFLNPTAAWDGFGNSKSATGACVIQYNSDFQGTIVNAAFDNTDTACTSYIGWNGNCGYPSMGTNGSYYGSGTSRFVHPCSLNANYYCGGDNMTGGGSGSTACYFKRKWYWIR